MKNVRAKFVCGAVTETTYGQKSVSMYAVYSNEGENASFSKATPSGQLTLNVEADTPASEYFKPGQSYYLDISEAPQ